MSSLAASPVGRREAVAAVAATLAPSVGWSCRSTALGAEALLCFDLDSDEHRRRQAAGLGAVVDVGVLELLLGLPLGQPVGRGDLGRWEQRAVAKAPPGCLRIGEGSVSRLARPPVSVRLAVLSARDWRVGLQRAGRLAPFTARAMALHRTPRDLPAACAEADFYGVGMFLVRDGSPARMLVAPEPYRAARLSARIWWFAEQAYRAHLADVPTHPGRAAAAGRA
ncbi:hypothetical protein MXD61_25100 [Frankia sp. AgPm24]|uniref:hypothetical protein n=1 Tax=Frankia sp. AgPm24 TaxID=631128 RepID=UPI00200F92FA|nr:hypothetical protein [Frankia sp. AgPm24]MCK9925106.1 hypothetical protein [Frankia sp. AgPm24]